MTVTKERALMQLCRALFTTNIIGTDFNDVQVLKVTGRNFPQQPDGAGLNISFSVSWHALGKMGEAGSGALAAFLPVEEVDEE